MESIRIENLTIGYKSGKADKIIMKNINLSLIKGKLVCLLGRNGIGKSTLLRTIAGLQSALEGNIYIENISIEKLNIKDLARYISIVLTEKIFPEYLTVYELIALGRTPYTNWLGNLNEQDKKIIQQSIDFVGLNELANTVVNELSDGEKQKVLIARALSQDTPIIILDEPTSHLDIYNRLVIMNILKKLAKENNKTILLSTHDYEVAIHLADKIWLMTPDKIHIGIPEDLILNGLFKTFAYGERPLSDEILFNEQQGNFYIKHKGNKFVNLKVLAPDGCNSDGVENEIAFIWTKKALERNGYIIKPPETDNIPPHVETHRSIKIEIISQNLSNFKFSNGLKWKISATSGFDISHRQISANSIEELLNILENY